MQRGKMRLTGATDNLVWVCKLNDLLFYTFASDIKLASTFIIVCVGDTILCCHYNTPKFALASVVWNKYDRIRTVTADHGDIIVPHARSTRFGCRSFRLCRPNNLEQTSTDSREQFKCRLKGWLFECAYGRRCTDWLIARFINGLTYLLTYLHAVDYFL